MEEIKPYSESNQGKKNQIKTMFDNISGNYDTLNRLFTFGMDLKWRRNVVKVLNDKSPESILDIATGTADMPILYAKTSAKKIVGVDISTGMLAMGEKKIQKLNLQDVITLAPGDAENLTFPDNSFDAVTVTYGIRNFEDLEKGIAEILRVLKPNGSLVILETSVPTNPIIKMGYLLYTKYGLPLWGALFSKDKKAYSYLATSALNFPYGEELKAIFEKVGFVNVQIKPQAQGISSIYVATKPV